MRLLVLFFTLNLIGCGYDKLTQIEPTPDSGTKPRSNIKAYSECSPDRSGAYGCSIFGHKITCLKLKYPEEDAGSVYYLWVTDGTDC